MDWDAGAALSSSFVKGIKVVHHISHNKQVLTEVYINHWKPSILMYGDKRPTLDELSDAVFDFEREGNWGTPDKEEHHEETNLKSY